MKKTSKYRVLFILSLAAFVMVIDSTSMNVSIAYLVDDLDSSIGEIQQIMALYTLTMAALMLPGAKLADIYGAKKIFLIGVCIYGTGTLLAALAVNAAMLMVGWAFVEGIAAACMMPTALSLISSSYTGKERSVAMAVYTAVSSVGVAVGPIFGGIITTYLSWRLVFGLEVVLIFIILANAKTIMAIHAPSGDRQIRNDISGAALSILALLLVITGGLRTQDHFIQALAMMLGGVLLLALLYRFLRWKKIAGRPILVDVSIFSAKAYNVVLLINLLLQICMAGIMFIISIYLQNILQYNALQTGLTLMPLSVMILLAALMVTKLSERIPQNAIVGVGSLTLLLGTLILYVFSRQGELISAGMMVPALSAVGIGIGCSMSLTGNIGLGALDKAYSNQAAGTLTTINNLGASLGTAIIGSLFLFQIRPQIVAQLMAAFPQALGQYTVQEASEVLEEAFQKVRVLDPGALDLPPETLDQIEQAVVTGVNHALGMVLVAMMALSVAAAGISFFALRPKPHQAGANGDPDRQS